MTLIIIDIILSFAIFYCIDKKTQIDKIKLFSMVPIFIVIISFCTGTFGDNFIISMFISHIVCLSAIAVVYRKTILSALTTWTIIYCILEIYSILFVNLIFEYIKEIFPIEYINYETIFIIYIPQWIVLLLCFKYMEIIKQIYKLIITEKLSTSLFIISFSLDFMLTFYVMSLNVASQLLKNITYIMFFLLLISIAVYFWRIHKKSQQIYKLNTYLEIKNSDLRKIKNDYGTQITYLYELGLMEKFDDLKNSLKDIINSNNSTPTTIEIDNNENSILSIALKPAIDKGIHVIMEDKCDLGLINMNEMELFRVISNIVTNAIKAMKNQGIIIAKSYESLGNVVILLSNNGPKIEEHYLKDIFKAGFTTKDDTDNNHGYGLSIVKDLVESHNGTIQVKSNDTATEFKIVLPIR